MSSLTRQIVSRWRKETLLAHVIYFIDTLYKGEHKRKNPNAQLFKIIICSAATLNEVQSSLTALPKATYHPPQGALHREADKV